MPEIPFLPDRETWVKTVRERDNLAAQLAQALVERDAFRLSVYELREQVRHSVSEEALADAQADLAAERAEAARVTELAITERDAARAKVARLTAAFKEYGWHLDGCPAADGSDTPCMCGFSAALRGDTAPAGGE